MGRRQRSSNRVSGISIRTIQQSTTPSMSQTIWSRWASRQFLCLLIVQTLLSVTFAYSLSSEAVVMIQLRRWKRLWRRLLTRSHKRTSKGGFQKLLELYNKCIAAEGDYFEGDKSFMCVLSIKVPTRKCLETYRMHLVYDLETPLHRCRRCIQQQTGLLPKRGSKNMNTYYHYLFLVLCLG